MKKLIHSIIAMLLLGFVSISSAQEIRRFGLGVIVGEPTGLSAKLWLSSRTALDFGLGWSYGGDRIRNYDGIYDGGSRVHFHMDHLWHWYNNMSSRERFAFYSGFGARINTGAGYKSSVAVRGVLGIAWLPRTAPIDLFLEIAPSLQLAPSTGIGIDGGFGVRYYF